MTVAAPWTPCRYPPVPQFPPIAFYSSVRLGDPEQLAKIMDTDPYFITQDNGAGGPIHFATTYRQLDMVRRRRRRLQPSGQKPPPSPCRHPLPAPRPFRPP